MLLFNNHLSISCSVKQ